MIAPFYYAGPLPCPWRNADGTLTTPVSFEALVEGDDAGKSPLMDVIQSCAPFWTLPAGVPVSGTLTSTQSNYASGADSAGTQTITFNGYLRPVKRYGNPADDDYYWISRPDDLRYGLELYCGMAFTVTAATYTFDFSGGAGHQEGSLLETDGVGGLWNANPPQLDYWHRIALKARSPGEDITEKVARLIPEVQFIGLPWIERDDFVSSPGQPIWAIGAADGTGADSGVLSIDLGSAWPDHVYTLPLRIPQSSPPAGGPPDQGPYYEFTSSGSIAVG